MQVIKAMNTQTIANSLFGLMILLSLSVYHPDYFVHDALKWVLIAVIAAIVLVSSSLNLMRALLFIKTASIKLDAVDIGLMVFTSYATLSLLWTPDPLAGVLSLMYWLMLWVLISSIKNAKLQSQQTNLHFIILAAVSIASVLVLITQQQHPERWGGFYNENFLTEFLLLTLPFVAGLTLSISKFDIKPVFKYSLMLLGLALLSWSGLYLLIKNPSKLEFFILPITFFVITLRWLWRVSRVYTSLILTFLLAALCALVYLNWGVSNGYRDSLISRMALNFDTFLMWWKTPIFGHGIGGFSFIFASYQELHFQYFPQLNFSVDKYGLAMAAHNDYLEFLSDFGLLGLLILALPIIAVVNRLRKQNQSSFNVTIWVGTVVIVMLLANAALEFPFQNPATGLLAAIAFGFLAYEAKLPVMVRIHQPVVITSVALTYLVLSSIFIYSAWRVDGSQKAYRNMAALYYVDPQSAFEANAEANRLNPLDFRIRVQLYESLVHWNRAFGMPPLPAAQYDAVYAKARTAGPQALMMLRRVEYLLDTQRYLERQDEVNETLEWLRLHFSRKSDVWIADAYYHVLMGRALAANLSLAQAKTLGLNAQQQERATMLEMVLQNQAMDQQGLQ